MTRRDQIRRAREALPGVTVDERAFEAFLADLPEAKHVEDLLLAFACAAGDPEALARFDRSCLSQIGSYVARVPGVRGLVDEIRQVLGEKLLVAVPPARPRLLEYAGKGPLGAWVRMIAIRTAIDLQRARGEEVGARGDVAGKAIAAGGAEVALLKARYQDEFQAALDEALGSLSPKQRQLLRMHIIDGISLDRMAVAHKVHRATIARWIATAREQLLETVQTRLKTKLDLSPSEVDSLAALVHSRLHISMARLAE